MIHYNVKVSALQDFVDTDKAKMLEINAEISCHMPFTTSKELIELINAAISEDGTIETIGVITEIHIKFTDAD